MNDDIKKIAQEAAELLFHSGPRDVDVTLNASIIESAIDKAREKWVSTPSVAAGQEKRLRDAFEEMLIKEIQRHGGIPANLPAEVIKFREVMCEFLYAAMRKDKP